MLRGTFSLRYIFCWFVVLLMFFKQKKQSHFGVTIYDFQIWHKQAYICNPCMLYAYCFFYVFEIICNYKGLQIGNRWQTLVVSVVKRPRSWNLIARRDQLCQPQKWFNSFERYLPPFAVDIVHAYVPKHNDVVRQKSIWKHEVVVQLRKRVSMDGLDASFASCWCWELGHIPMATLVI